MGGYNRYDDKFYVSGCIWMTGGGSFGMVSPQKPFLVTSWWHHEMWGSPQWENHRLGHLKMILQLGKFNKLLSFF